MNATLFDGLNRIRRSNQLTFTERKWLEVALHRRLNNEIPENQIHEVVRKIQVARADRGDHREIPIYDITLECLQLIKQVEVETAVVRG